MKILHKFTVFLFLAVFTANADPVDYTKNAIYFHPVSLLVGANDNELILYTTAEIPLNLYFAPIIQPSVWNGNGEFRIGGDLGIRHYLAGRGEGMYLQLQAGAFYFSVTDSKSNVADFASVTDDDFKSDRGTWIDGMLYLGNAYKFAYVNLYMDSGIGYGCVLGACSIRFDGNIGLGISF